MEQYSVLNVNKSSSKTSSLPVRCYGAKTLLARSRGRLNSASGSNFRVVDSAFARNLFETGGSQRVVIRLTVTDGAVAEGGGVGGGAYVDTFDVDVSGENVTADSLTDGQSEAVNIRLLEAVRRGWTSANATMAHAVRYRRARVQLEWLAESTNADFCANRRKSVASECGSDEGACLYDDDARTWSCEAKASATYASNCKKLDAVYSKKLATCHYPREVCPQVTGKVMKRNPDSRFVYVVVSILY